MKDILFCNENILSIKNPTAKQAVGFFCIPLTHFDIVQSTIKNDL